MTETKIKPVDELMNVGMALAKRLAPTHAETVVSESVKTALEEHTVDGISLVRGDAEAKLRASYEARFDEALAADLVQFDKDAKATTAALETKIEASRRPPTTRDDLRELLLLTRWQGRTIADLARAYERTRDEDDPVLVRLVEEEPRDVPRLFRLAPHDDDGAAIMRLQKAIEERRSARQDRTAVDALRALTEFRARNMLLSHGIGQARLGRLEVARMRRSRGAS